MMTQSQILLKVLLRKVSLKCSFNIMIKVAKIKEKSDCLLTPYLGLFTGLRIVFQSVSLKLHFRTPVFSQRSLWTPIFKILVRIYCLVQFHDSPC